MPASSTPPRRRLGRSQKRTLQGGFWSRAVGSWPGSEKKPARRQLRLRGTAAGCGCAWIAAPVLRQNSCACSLLLPVGRRRRARDVHGANSHPTAGARFADKGQRYEVEFGVIVHGRERELRVSAIDVVLQHEIGDHDGKKK